MARPKKQETKENESKVLDNPKSRKVRLMPDDSPIVEEQVESEFPSTQKEIQTEASGTKELEYELYDDKETDANDPVSSGEVGRIVSITVSKTVQKEQYEPDKVELSYSTVEGEDIEEVYKYLKDTAYYLLEID